MQDDREDVGGRDTFVHESFRLGPSLLLCGRGDLGDGGTGDGARPKRGS